MSILLRRREMYPIISPKFILFDGTNRGYTQESGSYKHGNISQTNDQGFTMALRVQNQYASYGNYGSHSFGTDSYGSYLGINTVRSSQDNAHAGSYLYSETALDYAGYSRLCFRVSLKNINAYFYRGIIATAGAISSTATQTLSASGSAQNNIVVKIPVRGVTNKPYFLIGAVGYSGGQSTATVKIYEIWLE